MNDVEALGQREKLGLVGKSEKLNTSAAVAETSSSSVGQLYPSAV